MHSLITESNECVKILFHSKDNILTLQNMSLKAKSETFPPEPSSFERGLEITPTVGDSTLRIFQPGSVMQQEFPEFLQQQHHELVSQQREGGTLMTLNKDSQTSDSTPTDADVVPAGPARVCMRRKHLNIAGSFCVHC